MNDICENFPCGGDSDNLPAASLLMDDLSTWAAAGDPLKVIDTLNKRLRDVYEWSVFNGMVFDFSKFNILSFGHNPIPEDLQGELKFGPGSPPWVPTARFIGAHLDALLTFKDQIKIVASNVKQNLHFLSPFSHFARGSQPSVLETNFQTYVWPRFIFTEPLWIFRIKSPFYYSAPFVYGYKTRFESLERLYLKCAKRILGVYPNTANLAVLVRLGWLPLEYKLALNAVMWCFRMLRGVGGPTLNAFYSMLQCDPDRLGRTATLQPAIDFVTHLNSFTDIDLFEVPFTRAREAIKSAMYSELTQYWRQIDSCKITRSIHLAWKPRKLASKIHSRVTTSCFHGFACGQGYLKSRRHKYGKCTSPDCRHGCNVAETAEHILVHCPFYNKERKLLTTLCNSFGLEVSMVTFLTDKRLQTRVERLIGRFLKTKDD